MITRALAAAMASCACLWAAPSLAQSDPVADFYRGRTITIAAGSSAGGGLDTYARLVGRHLSRFMPGNPTVVVQNMPGAGSLVAGRHLYSVAPKDGTHMATVLPSALIDPLLTGADRKNYDPTKFNYVGNANAETLVCVTRRDAPVKTFADVFEKELVLGATGPGSTLVDSPNVTRNMLGAKLRLVSGYQGSREVSLAVMKNEVQGVCGLAWSSAKQQYPDLMKPDSVVHVLVQEDSRTHPELAGKAPLAIDFAKTDRQRKVLDALYAQAVFTRPFLLPPGVPQERVAALRKAFVEALKSPELQEDARKQFTEANASPGEEVQASIERIYALDPAVIADLRKAVGK